MTVMKASFMKVEFVLDVARKDSRFLRDLLANPYGTLQESGIDLSTNETLAVLDIVNDTSVSTLAPHLTRARRLWKDICEDIGLPASAVFERMIATPV